MHTGINSIPLKIQTSNVKGKFVDLGMGHSTACIFFGDSLSDQSMCWGSCPHGVCDIPPTAMENVYSTSVGHDHACNIINSNIHYDKHEYIIFGSLLCWGSDQFGQISFPQLYKERVSDVLASDKSTCVLQVNQVIKCFGLLYNEEFLSLKDDFITVYSGGRHTCGGGRGKYRCWGSNEYGQLELYINEYYENPIIAAGWDYTCAIGNSTHLFCNGFNYLGQIEIPEKIQNQNNQFFTGTIAAGVNHTCYIVNKVNVCWGGWNEYGELDIPINTKINDISLGVDFTCIETTLYNPNNYGHRSYSKIDCYGNNDVGQLYQNNYNEFRFVSSLTSGIAHTCIIIMSMGSNLSHCWGSDKYGQSEVPGEYINSKQLSAGDAFTCAIDPKDKVRCWGYWIYPDEVKIGNDSSINGALKQRMRLEVYHDHDIKNKYDNVNFISASYEYWCGVNINFRIICKGDDEWGQINYGNINIHNI